jgi:uncharacterized membrane protein
MATPTAVNEGVYEETGVAPAAHPMEIWISYVLRIGVLVAGAIILVGLALFVIEGPSGTEPTSLHQVLAGGALTVHLGGIARGVASFDPIAIIQLGVLALVLTPLMRVAMTVILFVAQREWVFVAITATVLAILVLGLIGVGA